MAEADPHTVYNVHDAKTHLSKLIDRAHAGEEIILAKAGKPFAKIVPIDPPQALSRRSGRFVHLRSTIPSDIWFEPAFTADEPDGFEGE